MGLIAKYNDFTGTVIEEQKGRVLVNFGPYNMWIIRGAPGLEIGRDGAGRPRKFESNAERQRAYRERKAGKALRNYSHPCPARKN